MATTSSGGDLRGEHPLTQRNHTDDGDEEEVAEPELPDHSALLSSVDVDVETYVPKDPANDAVWLRLMVGPLDGPGEESFDVLVRTPRWLHDVVAKEVRGPDVIT